MLHLQFPFTLYAPQDVHLCTPTPPRRRPFPAHNTYNPIMTPRSLPTPSMRRQAFPHAECMHPNCTPSPPSPPPPPALAACIQQSTPDIDPRAFPVQFSLHAPQVHPHVLCMHFRHTSPAADMHTSCKTLTCEPASLAGANHTCQLGCKGRMKKRLLAKLSNQASK